MTLTPSFTFQVSGSVGILWKDAPEVGDGGDSHGHHPLDKHQGALLGPQLTGEQTCPLKNTTKTVRHLLVVAQETHTMAPCHRREPVMGEPETTWTRVIKQTSAVSAFLLHILPAAIFYVFLQQCVSHKD